MGVINSKINMRSALLTLSLLLFGASQLLAQSTYKKRVLETAEVDFLTSLYSQSGKNAAVSGGIGNEDLIDVTPTIVISIPLNDDDILTIDAGISAYTSASSSNVNPFDGNGTAGPFVESSGASKSDALTSATINYSHSSDDRNTILSGKLSVSSEYDYTSFGIGGSFTKLFNEKNTEISLSANAYFDSWKLIYPVELRTPGMGGDDDDDENFDLSRYTITGNPNYDPSFTPFSSSGRNSYSFGVVLSQILTRNLQSSFSLDVVLQDGLLSTPFQRVYFSDVDDSFIENFHLADDVERLPSSRFKIAGGTRFNYYLNEVFVFRTYYRYYSDDWGITSNTASLEIPIKVGERFTLYPSYRFYNQSQADYFAPYDSHLSTSEFYTSDYDLSEFSSNQFGFGVNYTDIFTSIKIWQFGLKSIDLRFNHYERDTGLTSNIIMLGTKFVMD